MIGLHEVTLKPASIIFFDNIVSNFLASEAEVSTAIQKETPKIKRKVIIHNKSNLKVTIFH